MKKPVIYFLLFVFIVALFAFDDIFLRKISNFDSIDSVVDKVARGTENKGGSAYLQGYEINSLQDVIFFAPLKLFYFFFSPVPWDIRNINDIIALVFDVIIYFYLFYLLLKKVRRLNWKDQTNQLFVSLLISILVTGLIFALGTANAGTALRHRHKLLVLIIFTVFLPIKSKSKLKQNIKIK